MVFDSAPVTTALSVPANQPVQQSAGFPTGQVSATPGSMPGDSLPSKITLWAQSLHRDLMTGSANTDIGKLYKSIGGQPLEAGQGKDAAEFMASPILGPLRMVQGGGEAAQAGQRWQETKDVIGGALDAATIPGSFVSPNAGELAGTAGDAVLSQAGRAGKALAKPFSLQAVQDALEGSHADIQQALETGTKAIQDDWHQTVRGIFAKVAQEADVQPEQATSLHDVAANVSDAVKAKAQGLYKQADEALGGVRFQNFQDSVRNIKQAIREEVGIDPERDAALQQRLADARAGHDLAKEQLATKGLDPGIIDTADALYKKAMALSDLSKPIQASISGLRADLSGGTSDVAESLSPAKMALRVNKLYDSGRLQQALGNDGAADLVTAIEDTKGRLKDVASAAKQQAEAVKSKAAQQTAAVRARIAAAGAAGGAALAGVPGYALLKHLLGSQ
jgi:hypothetical protein